MGKGPSVPQSAIDQQGQTQAVMSQLAQQYAGTALPMLNQAGNYWSTLLKGGPGAQNLVAPSAMNISDVYKGADNNIRNFQPMGGERNLALSQIPIQKANQIAGLYANVQPLAAQSLGSLGLGQAGAGTGLGGVSTQAGGSLTNLAGQQGQAKGAALGGLGSGIGSMVGSGLGGKSGGSGGGMLPMPPGFGSGISMSSVYG